jgi:hypothetical protein
MELKDGFDVILHWMSLTPFISFNNCNICFKQDTKKEKNAP